MKTIDPSELKIHIELPPVAKKGDIVSIDTEIFQMDENRLHRPHGLFAGMGCTDDGVNVYIVLNEKDIPEYMKRIDAGLHVYHNAKFDIGQIRRFTDYPDRKLLMDTMILEQIMFSGYYALNEFSLRDLARRWLDVYMEKDTRKEFETADKMTQEMIEYLAVDVVATWRVYQEQRKHADENDMNVWKIDRGAIYSILSMRGMKLDEKAWMDLYEHNLSESEKISNKYPDINIGSWQQVKKELNRLGCKVQSTGSKVISPYADDYEFVRDVLEFRKRQKAAGTYGKSFMENHLEEDGRIYSDFYVNGAATGRFSSSKPNVENIPVRDGPHFRKCFIADEGNVIIDADFSAQEPRIWAWWAQDELLIDIFRNKKDIYLSSAKLMFGWDMEKSDPRRNSRMKPTVLGAIFGLTAKGMQEKDQVPEKEGEEYLNAFWKAYPQSAEYRDRIKKSKSYVETIYGRKYWLNPYQWGYENNCLNSPVQGSAADIIKIAGYRFQKEIRKAGYEDCVWLINYIHDELLVECKKECQDWTMETLRKVMLETAESAHDGIPADIEIAVADNWADAH